MQAFFLCLLATTMLPTEVIMPSTFSVILGLGLYNSLAGIIIPSIITATGIFMFRQFFSTVRQRPPRWSAAGCTPRTTAGSSPRRCAGCGRRRVTLRPGHGPCNGSARGVDLQADGMFSERSANYAAHVSVPALLAMGRILERPVLTAAADTATRRQAELTDTGGRVETLASRRQDQFETFDGGALFPWFRAHAARTGDALTSRAAQRTVANSDSDAVLTLLAHGVEDPRALAPLPVPAADPAPQRPEVVELSPSGLVRIDHGTSTTVLFGGTDTARLGRVTSGTASRPVLARFLGRSAGVRELRLPCDFFALGPLRPGAPVATPAPEGSHRYLLQEEVGGEYDLEFNGRFAAAMGFSRRPAETVVLRTTLEATSRPDELTLRWDFTGPATAICLLLALDGLAAGADLGRDERGRLVLEPADASQDALPRGARCVLRGAEEQMDVTVAGELGGRAFYDPGEAYSFLGATDEPSGDVLLIPATTAAPLQLTLRLAPLS